MDGKNNEKVLNEARASVEELEHKFYTLSANEIKRRIGTLFYLLGCQ